MDSLPVPWYTGIPNWVHLIANLDFTGMLIMLRNSVSHEDSTTLEIRSEQLHVKLNRECISKTPHTEGNESWVGPGKEARVRTCSAFSICRVEW